MGEPSPRIPVEKEDEGRVIYSKPVVGHLNEAVGNAVVLWTSYKRYHWMLFGPRFRDLHKLFGDFADDVYGTIDELAERVRMLDGEPPTSLSAFEKMAVLEAGTASSPKEMVTEALGAVTEVIDCMKEGAEAAQKGNDPGSVDMFSKFVQIYEKQRWFLTQLSKNDA